MATYSGRRQSNFIAMTLCWVATVIGLFFLFAILITLFYKGLTAISPKMFASSLMVPPQLSGPRLSSEQRSSRSSKFSFPVYSKRTARDFARSIIIGTF